MKKGYRFELGGAQAAGTTRVAGWPKPFARSPVSAPQRGLKAARSSKTSTDDGMKKAAFVRSPVNAPSGGPTDPVPLATPLPLAGLDAMAAE